MITFIDLILKQNHHHRNGSFDLVNSPFILIGLARYIPNIKSKIIVRADEAASRYCKPRDNQWLLISNQV